MTKEEIATPKVANNSTNNTKETIKTISHETLFAHEKGEKSLVRKLAEKKADYTEYEVMDMVWSMASQITYGTLNAAYRRAESVELQREYSLTKTVMAAVTWEKLPKGAYGIPCGTFNSERPNQAFVWKEGANYKVAFKERPTYSMYRALNKEGILSEGCWTIAHANTDVLEKIFRKAWERRYIKG